jgi:flagellin
MSLTGLAIPATTTSIGTSTSALTSLALLETAIGTVNTQRSTIGAGINQMTYAVDNLSNVAANVAASRSTIMDTDYATASTQLSKTQIIQQAATAMLAQANQQPQSVLALLK